MPDPSKSKHSGRGHAHFCHGDGSVAICTKSARRHSRAFHQPSLHGWAVAVGRAPILSPAVGSAGVSSGPRGRTDAPGFLEVEHQKCCGRVCFGNQKCISCQVVMYYARSEDITEITSPGLNFEQMSDALSAAPPGSRNRRAARSRSLRFAISR